MNATVPDEVAAFVPGVAASLQDVLGEDLVGVYLHGSGLRGGFRPGASDVDLFVIVEKPLDIDGKSTLARAAWPASAGNPGRGMEWLVATRDQVAMAASGRYELLVSTHPREPQVIDGQLGRAAASTVVDFHIVRSIGRSFFGPPAAELISEIPRPALMEAMANDLRETVDEMPESFVILNACRSLRFAATGEHTSKGGGARWAIETGLDEDLVGRAVAAHEGRRADRPISGDGRRFVARVIRRLERSAR